MRDFKSKFVLLSLSLLFFCLSVTPSAITAEEAVERGLEKVRKNGRVEYGGRPNRVEWPSFQISRTSNRVIELFNPPPCPPEGPGIYEPPELKEVRKNDQGEYGGIPNRLARPSLQISRTPNRVHEWLTPPPCKPGGPGISVHPQPKGLYNPIGSHQFRGVEILPIVQSGGPDIPAPHHPRMSNIPTIHPPKGAYISTRHHPGSPNIPSRYHPGSPKISAPHQPRGPKISAPHHPGEPYIPATHHPGSPKIPSPFQPGGRIIQAPPQP